MLRGEKYPRMPDRITKQHPWRTILAVLASAVIVAATAEGGARVVLALNAATKL